jgi:hypothetical protein
MTQPTLRPQDVVVLAKLVGYGDGRPPMAQMGLELSLSASEVHAALRRLMLSKLVSGDADGNRPLAGAVEEFLVHAVKYAFPARRGEVTRGILTSYAAPPLDSAIQRGSEPPPVWPFADGRARGISLEPLYKTVPAAALRDPALYEMLALIDALRDGRARERGLAEKTLIARLRHQLHDRPESRAVRSRRSAAAAAAR